MSRISAIVRKHFDKYLEFTENGKIAVPGLNGALLSDVDKMPVAALAITAVSEEVDGVRKITCPGMEFQRGKISHCDSGICYAQTGRAKASNVQNAMKNRFQWYDRTLDKGEQGIQEVADYLNHAFRCLKHQYQLDNPDLTMYDGIWFWMNTRVHGRATNWTAERQDNVDRINEILMQANTYVNAAINLSSKYVNDPLPNILGFGSATITTELDEATCPARYTDNQCASCRACHGFDPEVWTPEEVRKIFTVRLFSHGDCWRWEMAEAIRRLIAMNEPSVIPMGVGAPINIVYPLHFAAAQGFTEQWQAEFQLATGHSVAEFRPHKHTSKEV